MERGYLRETNIFSKLRNLAREKRHHNIIKALPVSTEQQLEVEVAEGDSMCQREEEWFIIIKRIEVVVELQELADMAWIKTKQNQTMKQLNQLIEKYILAD